MDFRVNIAELMKAGYGRAAAQARVAHDVVLEAIKLAGFKDRVTIKGGVAMGGISKSARRATMDMDVDFVHCSLSNAAIVRFVSQLNKTGIAKIEAVGEIAELRQQEYRGKRLHLAITDGHGYRVMTKVDLGVHAKMDVVQKNLAFDLVTNGNTVRLLANSKEQIFVEKLKGYLRLGTLSSRYKDAFDMYYLLPSLNRTVLKRYLAIYIYRDGTMRERTASAIVARLKSVFDDSLFLRNLRHRKFAWLDADPNEIVAGILEFLGRC